MRKQKFHDLGFMLAGGIQECRVPTLVLVATGTYSIPGSVMIPSDRK